MRMIELHVIMDENNFIAIKSRMETNGIIVARLRVVKNHASDLFLYFPA